MRRSSGVHYTGIDTVRSYIVGGDATIVHSTQHAMRPTSASGAHGYKPSVPPADLARRPMTAVASDRSNHTNDRPTLIGRPTLINPAERARILQSQRAAALRRRNVQLRIAKIEAEPVAEWQSLSKPVAPHQYAGVPDLAEPQFPRPFQCATWQWRWNQTQRSYRESAQARPNRNTPNF